MLRILMTTDTLGGVWTYALELARDLGNYRVKISLATLGQALTVDQKEALSQLPHVEVYESQYRLEWMEDPWADLNEAGKWLLQLESKIRPDVIHLNHYCHGQLHWRAPTLMVAHSDVYSWFFHVKKERPPSEWNRYYQEVREGLIRARTLIAPTQSVAADLQRLYDMNRTIRVIPNGRSLTLFQDLAKQRYALSVGRLWDDAKNLQTLDQIAGQLNFPVFVAGSTRNPNGKEVLLRSVQTLGELPPDQLARTYAHAAVYVHPAKYEPFGLSVLEAALSGCALLLGNVPSLFENWENAALFFDPDRPDELVYFLRKIMENESLRNELASQARDRAQQFTAHRMSSAYYQEYSRLSHRPEIAISQEQFVPL